MTLYFSFDGPPPIVDPILVLNGENKITPNDDIYPVAINNVCFPSSLSEDYAPVGKSLASISVIGTFDQEIVPAPELEKQVRLQLEEWWGPSVQSWKLLRIYRSVSSQLINVTTQKDWVRTMKIVSKLCQSTIW